VGKGACGRTRRKFRQSEARFLPTRKIPSNIDINKPGKKKKTGKQVGGYPEKDPTIKFKLML